MRGLDPRIHPSARANGGMDRRNKPGDDNRSGMAEQGSAGRVGLETPTFDGRYSAASTWSTVPTIPVTRTRAPTGASGPSARHRLSPTLTVPRPLTIA